MGLPLFSSPSQGDGKYGEIGSFCVTSQPVDVRATSRTYRCILLESQTLTPKLLNNFMLGVGDALDQILALILTFLSRSSIVQNWQSTLNTGYFRQCQKITLLITISYIYQHLVTYRSEKLIVKLLLLAG